MCQVCVRASDKRVSARTCLSSITLKPRSLLYNDLTDEVCLLYGSLQCNCFHLSLNSDDVRQHFIHRWLFICLTHLCHHLHHCLLFLTAILQVNLGELVTEASVPCGSRDCKWVVVVPSGRDPAYSVPIR